MLTNAKIFDLLTIFILLGILNHVSIVQSEEVFDTHFTGDAPAPGSYQLHKIKTAPQGSVLDTDGKANPLTNYVTGKVTLLSFIYTMCSDTNGCPLAFAVLYQLKQLIESDPYLQDKTRLVSLSFDPKNDTPETMGLYKNTYASEQDFVEWDFLTTSSDKTLQPLLEGFGQYISVEKNKDSDSSTLIHVLKLFLIDKEGVIREIYTTSYLYPKMIMNDFRTLLLEYENE
tara:strand:+ start:2319 stop:3005 length:687 start_codon:yes stop_codon:yes gene_type:complete